jgi:hypothetical protein
MELKYIIYLVIGILWLIFNVIKKKQQPPARSRPAPPAGEAPQPPSAPKLPDEFSFLEELLKEKEEEKEPEPVQKKPVVRPTPRKAPAPFSYETYESQGSLETITSEITGTLQNDLSSGSPQSKIFQEEPESAYSSPYSIHSSDEARKAIIWSEILNRPYQ